MIQGEREADFPSGTLGRVEGQDPAGDPCRCWAPGPPLTGSKSGIPACAHGSRPIWTQGSRSLLKSAQPEPGLTQAVSGLTAHTLVLLFSIYSQNQSPLSQWSYRSPRNLQERDLTVQKNLVPFLKELRGVAGGPNQMPAFLWAETQTHSPHGALDWLSEQCGY